MGHRRQWFENSAYVEQVGHYRPSGECPNCLTSEEKFIAFVHGNAFGGAGIAALTLLCLEGS